MAEPVSTAAAAAEVIDKAEKGLGALEKLGKFVAPVGRSLGAFLHGENAIAQRRAARQLELEGEAASVRSKKAAATREENRNKREERAEEERVREADLAHERKQSELRVSEARAMSQIAVDAEAQRAAAAGALAVQMATAQAIAAGAARDEQAARTHRIMNDNLDAALAVVVVELIKQGRDAYVGEASQVMTSMREMMLNIQTKFEMLPAPEVVNVEAAPS